MKKGKGFAVVYGVAVLAKFKTEEIAKKMLDGNKSYFKFWSESASVSYQNRIAEGDCVIISA